VKQGGEIQKEGTSFKGDGREQIEGGIEWRGD